MLSLEQSYEFEAETVEEAIKRAMASLKVPRESMKIKIFSEAQKGLFGMPGAKPATIKVSIKKKKT